jgi:Integrase zinc binding domain/Integrase core domain
MTTKKLNARQARWAEFLSRFYFLIKYRPGKQNTLADALTRRETNSLTDQADHNHRLQILLKPEAIDEQIQQERLRAEPISIAPIEPEPISVAPIDPELQIVDQVLQANRTSSSLDEYRKEAEAGKEGSPWTLEDGLLSYHGKLEVPGDDPVLRTRLLDDIHRQASTAHPGRSKTRQLVSARYHWVGLRKDVDRYVGNCMKCRRTENPRDKAPGLLKPLPIPNRPWQHIAMDYQSLPKDEYGYDAVLVVVDRLGKKPISIPCYKTDGAAELAELFETHIYRHYGAPDTIVSDRGGQFISEFWTEFCRILGVKLKLSTSHHPPTDGQTEIVNQHIQMRLRPFMNYYQTNWSRLLPLIDHAAAILPHESTGVSPFLATFGYEPRTSFDWQPIPVDAPRHVKLERQAAIQRVQRIEEIWNYVRHRMEKAQDAQRTQANRHRREVNFQVGDKVWLILKDYKTGRPSKKLDYQMAGKFPIIEKVGNSYKLQLPPSMKIWPIFSPDKLRKARNDPLPGQVEDEGEPIEIDGHKEYEVEEILASRLHYRKLQYRAKWLGTDHDPTWYPASDFKGCPHRIRDFHHRHPDKPGPPRRLSGWIRAWEDGNELPWEAVDELPA